MSSSSLFTAAQQGDLPRLQALLTSGECSPNDRDKDQVTALHWAAINNHLAVVKHLIHAGAEVDVVGGELQSTPLHWAVRQGHEAVVHYLVTSGANLLTCDAQGFSALHLAAQYGHVYLVLYFLVLGVDVDMLDRDRRTALMWAVYKGNSAEIVPLLIKFGATLDLVDVIKCSALHWGALKANRIACQQLIKAGANLEGKDDKGLTPAGCAAEKGHSGWFQSILKDAQIEKSRFNKESRKKIVYLLPYVIIPSMFAVFSYLPWFFAILIFGAVVYGTKNLLSYLNGLTPLMQTPFQTAIFQASFTLVGFTYFTTIFWATGEYVILNVSLFIFAVLVVYFLPKTTLVDPGYIPLPAVSSLKNIVVDLLDKNMLNKRHFCATCLIHRPLRSKHDRESDRCVALFDHYCPWVFNAVAVNNHRNFLIFLGAATFSQLVFNFLSVIYLIKETDLSLPVEPSCYLPGSLCSYFTQHPWIIYAVLWCSFNCFWQFLTFSAQVYQISHGTTTNEQINAARYDYLYEQDPENPSKRRYKNPFDLGFIPNWADFCLGNGSNSKINWFDTYDVPKPGQLHP